MVVTLDLLEGLVVGGNSAVHAGAGVVTNGEAKTETPNVPLMDETG